MKTSLLKSFLNIISLLFFTLTGNSQELIPVFPLNSESYACFRIPALITLPNDELFAFAEGRKNNCSDFGDVDIVMKRSSDGGKSWSLLKVLTDNDSLQAGNIAPVVDILDPRYPKGRIFLFYNTGNAYEWEIRAGKGVREIWYIVSDDGGRKWSLPINITTQVHFPNQPSVNPAYNSKADWRGYANGPGHALQLTEGEFKGRIIVPANHTQGEPQKDWSDCFAHVFYSDDHGQTFHVSKNVTIPGSNEATAAMRSDGSVMLNIRNQKGDPKCRIIAISSNGGALWDTCYFEKKLIDPVCQGSLLAILFRHKHVMLFSNPGSDSKREKLTISSSFDDSKSWSNRYLAYDGEAAYSDITLIGRNKLGILFEKGSDGGIYFLKVKLKNIIK
jgi:sialidase-1